ncbi:MAG: cell surface protein [Deltaproteobacteria bacterium]|nr:cell surface protein [Deltaproteobacteria bacterium]
MPRFSIFIIVFCASAFSCGHSSMVFDGSADVPSLTANASPALFDWRKAREDAAGGTDATEDPLPDTNIAPSVTFAESDPENPLDAFIQEFVLFAPGPGSRFGQDSMNTWLLGPPFGGGLYVQSADVVSLGNGGEIILSFPRFFPINGDGPDFIIFENAFTPRGSATLFMEPGIVGVSQDGIDFVDFPCSLSAPYTGCAGTHAVLANPDYNTINPRDPDTAGGDAYDLQTLGLNYIKYIRIRDSNLKLAGEAATSTGQAGFDLDAIAIVHGAKP